MAGRLKTAPLTFPCPFPVKLFLKPDVEAEIERRARAQLAHDASFEIRRRPSRSGSYVCMTLVFTASDAGHARRICTALRDLPGVILAI
ncbi:MAG: DUF493 family protein [Gammaproteobacteria bacterium]|nr:DUF493 family protein [Gammaproteobacteria bacterium]